MRDLGPAAATALRYGLRPSAPSEKLPEMYGLWQQGLEVVEGIKNYRGKGPLIHRGLVNLFSKLLSKCTKMNMKNASDYKLLDRKVVNAL